MSQAFTKLITEKNYEKNDPKSSNPIELIAHGYTGKLLLKSANENLSVLARDPITKEFPLTSATLNGPIRSLTSPISLKLEEKLVEQVFKKVNWSSILKDENTIVNSLVKSFFEGLSRAILL